MLLVVLMLAAGAEPQHDLTRFGPLPRDVVAFIERRTACNHFAGEFNGDRSARDREVNRAMRELRCGTLERDEARLAKRHATRPQALKALTETRDWQ